MRLTEVIKKIPSLFSSHQSLLKNEMKQFQNNIISILKNKKPYAEEHLLKYCDACDDKSLHFYGMTEVDEWYFELTACTSHKCGWSQFDLYLPTKKNEEELSDECEEFESIKFLSKSETDYVNKYIKENNVIDLEDF